MDFTLTEYSRFLKALLKNNASFETFRGYLESRNKLKQHESLSSVILRHDVDRIPQNALKMAQLENSLGINGTYYFRIVKESFDKDIIKEVARLGHEIGYHYEELDTSSKGTNKSANRDSLIDSAYLSFCSNLNTIREVAEIKTICMHGSPRSKYDNKDIWKKYDYRKLEIIGEPYFDIDYNEFVYFTDTGRRWNGNRVSVRDKVKSRYSFDFKNTNDIIKNIEILPSKICFTIHPERWNNNMLIWGKELVFQNIKNLIKGWIIVNSKS